MRVVMIAEYDVSEDERAIGAAMDEFGRTVRAAAWPYMAPRTYVAINEMADAVIAIVGTT